MGNWNMVQFVMEAAIDLANFEDGIQNAVSYEKADAEAKKMLGYIKCLDTINNIAIKVEGNERFTTDFDKALTDWESRCYQALWDEAKVTRQNPDLIAELLKKWNELRGRYQEGVII